MDVEEQEKITNESGAWAEEGQWQHVVDSQVVVGVCISAELN